MSSEMPAPATGLAARMRRAVKALHRDEAGLNTIEIILIIFVAVIILIAILEFTENTLWNNIKDKIKDLLNMSVSS